MRELTGHKVNGVNDGIAVEAVDEPGSGGACHRYAIKFGQGTPNAAWYAINFQNGPIAEVGANGITHEALLAILIDRMEAFQAGPYKCEENQDALNALTAAQHALKSRTLKRLARGVEGTHKV